MPKARSDLAERRAAPVTHFRRTILEALRSGPKTRAEFTMIFASHRPYASSFERDAVLDDLIAQGRIRAAWEDHMTFPESDKPITRRLLTFRLVSASDAGSLIPTDRKRGRA